MSLYCQDHGETEEDFAKPVSISKRKTKDSNKEAWPISKACPQDFKDLFWVAQKIYSSLTGSEQIPKRSKSGS
jgi:hypothetical protein